MAKAVVATVVLAVSLAALYFVLGGRDAVELDRIGDSDAAAVKDLDPENSNDVCLQREAADSVVITAGAECKLNEYVSGQDTLGVTVEPRGQTVVVTGYDL